MFSSSCNPCSHTYPRKTYRASAGYLAKRGAGQDCKASKKVSARHVPRGCSSPCVHGGAQGFARPGRRARSLHASRALVNGLVTASARSLSANMGDYGPAEKIKADDIAAVFRSEIRADVEALKAQGVHPTLVGFLGTGDVSAKKYSEWTMKACEADGIKFEVREVLALSSVRLQLRAYT